MLQIPDGIEAGSFIKPGDGANYLTFGAAASTPKEVDSGELLRDMRLRTQRAILEKHLEQKGITIGEGEVQDPIDIQVIRHFSRIAVDDWELMLLEVPKWIMSDGNRWRDLDVLRHGFREKAVRFVCPNLNLPCPAVRRLFEAWKKNDGINAQLIPWDDIGYLEARQSTVEEVLGLESPLPVKTGSASMGEHDSPATNRDRVFISYSHRDPLWFERLKTHLSPLEDKIDVWNDEDIQMGADWFSEIQENLDRAKIAVLLVTPEFVASKFIKTHELPKILEAAGRRELTLCWVLVSQSHFAHIGLDKTQAPHDVSKPLDSLSKSKRNEVLKDITAKILEAYSEG